MTLIEHIDVIEMEIQKMAKDGHQVNPLTMKAMLAIDEAIQLLHKSNRDNNNE